MDRVAAAVLQGRLQSLRGYRGNKNFILKNILGLKIGLGEINTRGQTCSGIISVNFSQANFVSCARKSCASKTGKHVSLQTFLPRVSVWKSWLLSARTQKVRCGSRQNPLAFSFHSHFIISFQRAQCAISTCSHFAFQGVLRTP